MRPDETEVTVDVDSELLSREREGGKHEGRLSHFQFFKND